jgi:hypothetical protein
MQRDENDDREENAGSDEDTGIEVKTGFFPLAWILLLCTPRIAINGRERQRPWGTHFFPLRPGEYDVEVWFPYLWMPKCSLAARKVEVHPGETTHVGFYVWPFFFMTGSLTVTHGKRSEATRNASGGAPMSKAPILMIVGIPLALVGAFFACCCGINLFAMMASSTAR